MIILNWEPLITENSNWRVVHGTDYYDIQLLCIKKYFSQNRTFFTNNNYFYCAFSG